MKILVKDGTQLSWAFKGSKQNGNGEIRNSEFRAGKMKMGVVEIEQAF